MAGSVIVEVIGGVLGISILFIILGIIITLGEHGLFDWINEGMDSLSYLLGTEITNILVSIVIGIFIIMFARFILSWIGENGGQTANQG